MENRRPSALSGCFGSTPSTDQFAGTLPVMSSGSGGTGEYPAHESTGNLGYFGNRGSTADSVQR